MFLDANAKHEKKKDCSLQNSLLYLVNIYLQGVNHSL
jgi:hypothetical protein